MNEAEGSPKSRSSGDGIGPRVGGAEGVCSAACPTVLCDELTLTSGKVLH